MDGKMMFRGRHALWLCLLVGLASAQDDPRDRNGGFRGHSAVSELIRDRIRIVAEVYEDIAIDEIKAGLIQVLGQRDLRPADLILLPDQPELRREPIVRGEVYDRRLPGVMFLTLKQAESLFVRIPTGEGTRVERLPLVASGTPSGQYDVYEVETNMRNQPLEGLHFKVNDGEWEEGLAFLRSREALKQVASYTFTLGNVPFDLNALREDEAAIGLDGGGDSGLPSELKLHMTIDEVAIKARGSTSSFGFGIVLSGANYIFANLRFQSGRNFSIERVQHAYQGERGAPDIREAFRGEFRLVDSAFGTKELLFVPEAELPRGEEGTRHYCFYRELDDGPPGSVDTRYTNFETVVSSVMTRGEVSYDVEERFSVHVYEVRGKNGKLAEKGSISLQDLRELDQRYDAARDDMSSDFDGEIYRRRVRRR